MLQWIVTVWCSMNFICATWHCNVVGETEFTALVCVGYEEVCMCDGGEADVNCLCLPVRLEH